MVLDDSDSAVSDGDDGALLDELDGFSLEESVGGSGFISDDSTNKGGLSVIALRLFDLDNAHIDVVAVPGINETVNLHEGGDGKLRHKC